AFANLGLEAGQLVLDLVLARRDRREAIDAVGAGRIGARALHRRTGDRDGDARHHRSARIGDLAVDGAGGGADGLAESCGPEPEAEEKHQRGSQAVQPPPARPPWIEYTERTRNPPPPRKNFEFARTLHLNPGPAQSDFVRSRRLSGGRAGSWIVEQQGSVRLDDSRRRIERHANRL